MKFKVFVVFAMINSSLVFAQMIPGGPGPGGRGPGGRGMGGPGGMHSNKIVTGAPYSATFTNTTVKTLTDGNTIQHTASGTVSRDSQGRTYSQETIAGLFGQQGTKTFTFISDPVAGYIYTLNSDDKTAMRRALHTPSTATTTTNSMSDRGPKHTSANAVTADLGTQVVNGVPAQGKLVTHTVPAGEMGNEKPIVSTTETWYSADLQTVISSKRTDLREGVSTYALTNIQRTEPASALFTVPADYTIKDAQSFGRHQ